VENILNKKSTVFAVRVIKLYQFLADKKKEYVLSKQVLRSGTAIGAVDAH
jgi:four helix bundle protein